MDWKNMTLQSFWKLGRDKLVFIFCAGLLLFILALPTEKKSSKVSAEIEGTEAGTDIGESDHEAELEDRIRTILEGVEGVGQVDVMVGTTALQTDDYVAFEREIYPEVTGVVISADGGGSQLVKNEISQAMEALFGIPSHKIKVLKRVKKESEE